MSKPPPHLPEGRPAARADALSDAALVRASSPAILERGRTYAASGAVEVLSEDPLPEPALHARVTGTERYTVEVRIEDDAVAGDCDCPNADDGWFCKHQVATALVWRDRLAGKAPAVDEAARRKVQAVARRAQTVKDQRQALHDFLHAQPARALADRLLDLADRDRDVARELQQWRRLRDLGEGDAAGLKSVVADMLSPGRGFLSRRESGSWARRGEAVLPVLRQARRRDAAAAVALGGHALRCAWKALAQGDDSDGEIGRLCEAIGAEWLLALEAAGPRPAAFGEAYLQLRLDDPFGSFDDEAAEAAIGAAALGRFRQALAARWREAKDAALKLKAGQAAKAGARRRSTSLMHLSADDVRLLTLERLHLGQLEAAGDLDGALAVLREDLSSAQAHGRAIAFLEAHGRPREAFAQAEAGCKAFPDDWRLEEQLLRCYERDGWTEEALALVRRRFDRMPSVEGWRAVLRAGQAAGSDAATLRAGLLAALEAREAAGPSHALDLPPALAARLPAPRRPGPAPAVRDVSLRAAILASEGRWSEACALVQPPAECSDDVLGAIALHLPPAEAEAALALLLRVFDRRMRTASSPYRDELALAAEIARRMDGARRSAWLAQLRAAYRAKRNFVAGLPQR